MAEHGAHLERQVVGDPVDRLVDVEHGPGGTASSRRASRPMTTAAMANTTAATMSPYRTTTPGQASPALGGSEPAATGRVEPQMPMRWASSSRW